MRYLIDGYNLMFRRPGTTRNFQDKRRITITELAQCSEELNLDISIVFDAQYTPDEASKGNYGALDIFFTSHAQTADEWILDEISQVKAPHKHTVVTSDKELAFRVRQLGAHAVTVETFTTWLDKRQFNIKHKKPYPKKSIIPVLPPPKPVPEIPKAPQTIEERFDFYMEIFSRDPPPPLKHEPAYENPFKYYLEAFSKRLKEEDWE